MALKLEAQPVPLLLAHDGVVRVIGSRVTLDTIVAAFQTGATAEEIVQQYPSLQLADVYAVIAYYLRQRPEVETYLRERHRLAKRVRAQTRSRFDTTGVRDRLLARRTKPTVRSDDSAGG